MNYKIELGKYIIELTKTDYLLIKSILAITIVLLTIAIIILLFTNEEKRKTIKKYIFIGFWINVGILLFNIIIALVIASILALIFLL